MDTTELVSNLSQKFQGLKVSSSAPLAPLTTLKIGGPADILIEPKDTTELMSVLKFLSSAIGEDDVFFRAQSSEAHAAGREHDKKISSSQLPITILGNGSNVLISDAGIRGIVIKNVGTQIDVVDTAPIKVDFHHTYTQRHENEPEKYLDFTKLDYDESDKPQVLVKLTSGTPLPLAINNLINQGITGLQWFAYIPGTIGGATWYNIHGGSYHFADYIDSVEYFDLSDGQTKTYFKNQAKVDGEANNFQDRSERVTPTNVGGQPEGSENRQNSFASQDQFAYETTPFQQHPEWIILSTTLRLFRGDAALAKSVKDAWLAQKVKVQPMNSAGSVFANPSLADCTRVWGEQKSSGWIIDHELNWKGKTVGGAQISLLHSNFIVNASHATATDYLSLARLVQAEVKARFNIDLKMEVKLLGDFAA
jgi:UDP-N-acetylmuramate dehydrogenase